MWWEVECEGIREDSLRLTSVAACPGYGLPTLEHMATNDEPWTVTKQVNHIRGSDTKPGT